MQVHTINNTNNITMNGNVKIRGHVTRILGSTILESGYFKNLAQGNDVIVRCSYKFPGYTDKGIELLSKVNYSLLKENSLADKILDAFHLKQRTNFNKQFLAVNELIDMLKADNKVK